MLIQPLSKKKMFKKSKIVLLITLGMALSACQSLPTNSQPKNNYHRQLTAHQLMQQTMLHRFDNSYDYEKTTKYQIDSLFDKTDLEKDDYSIFFTILQMFANKDSDDNRQGDSALLACEDDYSKQYQQVLKDLTKQQGRIRQDEANQRIEKIQQQYDECLDNIPETVDGVLADVVGINGEIVSSDDNEIETLINSETSTDDNVVANAASNYQITLEKMTAKVKEINEKNRKAYENGEDDDNELLDDFNEYRKIDKRNFAKLVMDFRLTPEQIDVLNQTYIQPQTITYKGSYHQPTGEFSTVFEENYQTDYRQSYKRVPVLINMNDMSIVFEPDVLLPLMSLITDKEIPQDLAGKSIKFVLPDNIRQNFPLPVLKDSLIKAIGQAYGDIDKEKFNELQMDDYGNSIHAKRLVKVHFTTHDVGFMVGRTLKYWAKELNQIRQKHPEYIKDGEKFAVTLEFLTEVNKLYRAEDLAKLAQLLESVLPLSYNSYNYYYFNSQNQLIGYRKIKDYRSGLLNAKAQSITTNVIRYHHQNKQHTFYQPKSTDIIDGNALYQQLMGNDKRHREAEKARLDYFLLELTENDENQDETTND